MARSAIVGLGEYSKKMTTNISKEIGHSQTPLIINFGKDNPDLPAKVEKMLLMQLSSRSISPALPEFDEDQPY